MSAGFGATYSMLWADCVLDGWCLRTHRGLLPGFPPSSIDWPSSVMWDEQGYSVQPPLEPAIAGNGGSLLPTPCAQPSANTPEEHMVKKYRADGSARSTVTDLQVLVTGCLLPTPTSTDARSAARFAPDGKAHSPRNGLGLTDWARGTALLPTPMARDGDGRTGGRRNAANRINRGQGPMLPELMDWIARSSPECQTGPSGTTAQHSDDMQLF